MDNNAAMVSSFLKAKELISSGAFVTIDRSSRTISLKPKWADTPENRSLVELATPILMNPGACYQLVKHEFHAAAEFAQGLFGRCKNEDLKRSSQEFQEWFWDRLKTYYIESDTVGMISLVNQYAEVCYTNLPKLTSRPAANQMEVVSGGSERKAGQKTQEIPFA